MQEQELIKWSDSLLTYVPVIDDQHKHFVKLLNNLYIKYETIAPKEEIDNLIIDLVSYAKAHFNTEEEYMKKYNFDGLIEHHQIHLDMFDKLSSLEETYNIEGKKALPSLFDFLEDWLVKHLDM